MRYWCALLVVALAGAVQCPNSGIGNRTSVKLQLDGVWKEVSGVAVSTQTYNGEAVVWIHDDSGGVHALGLFGMFSGQLIQRFDLPNDPEIPFEDPEDIAVGACGATWPYMGTGECIYLGDIGDNNKVRNNYRIYKMREPVLAGLTAGATSQFQLNQMQILRFVYDTSLGAPTVHSDCETLFVDSVGQEPGEAPGDVYVVTKWFNSSEYGNARLYRYPNSAQDGNQTFHLQVASDAQSLKETAWTRGDMSRDGSIVIIGGYFLTRVFHREKGTTIPAMFNSSGLCANAGLSPPLDAQIQQEACGLTPVPPYAALEAGECFQALPCNASLYHTPLLTLTSAPSPNSTSNSTSNSTLAPSPVNHASSRSIYLPLILSAIYLLL